MIATKQPSRIKIIFLFAIIALLVLSFVSFIRIKTLTDASGLVSHTQDVMLEVEKSYSIIKEVESSQRGFMLTRDSVYLLPIINADKNLNLHLDNVASLTKDNPVQQKNVIELRGAMIKRVSYLKSVLNDAATSSIPAETLLVGKKLMDDVSKQVSKMKKEEERLLKIRSAELNKSAFITPLFTIFLIIVSIAIVVAAYFKIIKELKISDKLKSEAQFASKTIEERESRLQTIFEAAPDAVIIIDHSGVITNWNSESENIFGWKKSEAVGKALTDTIIPERYREAHKNGLKHFLASGEGRVLNKPIEIHAIKKDNTEIPIELKISASVLKNEHPVFIGFVRDITKRKQTEEEIINKTFQLEEAQQLAHIGSWEWNVPANKIEWSDELYRIYGLAPQEFKADYESFLRYIHPDDRDYVNGIVQQAFQSHEPFNFSHKVICPDGTIKVVSSTGKVFTDKNGNTIRMSGTAQDVTEQKKYEAELKASQEQLNLNNDALLRSNQELESFNYISSHDLQEPLRQIQNFTSRISDVEQGNLSAKGKEYFIKINKAANRMQTLIADLLTYSRTKTEERKFVITNLNEIVEDVKEELKEIIDEKDATVEVVKMCDVKIIPFQFRQLMHNIIGNALKFSKPGTPPHIIIKNENIKYSQPNDANLSPGVEYCHITIKDNGIGFEPQYKERIFEVFQRLHDKQTMQGTGIGLAIVKKIVENHNGVITATSELNKGATFDIYIPKT